MAGELVRQLGRARRLLPKAELAVRPVVRADPILIAETGAEPATNQSAKVADLFAGVKAYGLLGFVYFDTTNSIGQPFGFSSSAAIAAYRKGASTYHRPGS